MVDTVVEEESEVSEEIEESKLSEKIKEESKLSEKIEEGSERSENIIREYLCIPPTSTRRGSFPSI